ncbi:MAG: hypothetical protein PHF72_08990 [Gammaproteobacteria bacterium]|nr:hypothetical protein [Gammaproteobacteria bacterium]
MKSTALLFIPLAALLASPGYSAAPDVPVAGRIEPGPNLSGTWILDEASSDDPGEMLERFRERMDKPGKSRGRMGAASGAGGGPAGGMRGGARAGRSRSHGRDSMPDPQVFETLNELVSAAGVLELAHKEPELMLSTDRGHSQRLYTDNRGSTISLSGGIHQVVTVAGWENGDLVVETTRDGIPRVVQRFRLIAGAGQLAVITELTPPGSSGPVTIQYIYTRAEPDGRSIRDTDT